MHKRVRDAAAREDKSTANAINEALTGWLASKSGNPISDTWLNIGKEATLNNDKYEKLRSKLVRKTGERYGVITRGELIGIFPNLKEAAAASIKSSGRHGIVTKIGPKEPRLVKFG